MDFSSAQSGRHLHFSAALASQLRRALADYCADSGVRYAALIEEGGTLCADAGDDTLRDSAEIAALAVGAFAALQAVAERLGDDQFEGFFHEGARRQFCFTPVTPKFLLLSAFQPPARFGVVKICAQKVIARLRDPLELLSLSGAGGEKSGIFHPPPISDGGNSAGTSQDSFSMAGEGAFPVSPGSGGTFASPRSPGRNGFEPGDWVLGPETHFPRD